MRKTANLFQGAFRKSCFCAFAFLLAACAIQTPEPTFTANPTDTPSPTKTTTITPSPSAPTPTLSPTIIVPTMTPGPEVCSPLAGVEIPDLEALIVNRFAPPRPGSDDPHQGVDIAEIEPVNLIALSGKAVHAVMHGTVAGVVEDRFPYGNAIVVETPLEGLSPDWIPILQIPTPAPYQKGHPSLTCPEGEHHLNMDESHRSLYLIYAHLNEPPVFEIGETVKCGQVLNAIGNSGNSLNPHLHLELRVGPAGASFESMAHYTGSANPQEMYNYCLWRVSETFQLLDPMRLFETQTK